MKRARFFLLTAGLLWGVSIVRAEEGRAGPIEIDLAISRLADPVIEVRQEAQARILGWWLQDPEAVASRLTLAKEKGSSDPETGATCAVLLLKIRTERLRREALAATADDPLMRRQVDTAFKGVPADGLATVSAEGLNRVIYSVRSRRPEVLEAACAFLEDPDPGLQGSALRGVSVLGGASDAHRVLPFLKSPVTKVRLEAINALKALEARESLPAVARCLRDPVAQVRRTALDCIAAWQARACAVEVARLLSDTDRGARRQAADLLGSLVGEAWQGRENGSALGAALAWWTRHKAACPGAGCPYGCVGE